MPGSATELDPFAGLKAYDPITDQVRINKHPNSIYVERDSQKYFGDAEIQWIGRKEKKANTTTKLECPGKTVPSQISIISFAMPEEPGGEDQCLTVVQSAWMECT